MLLLSGCSNGKVSFNFPGTTLDKNEYSYRILPLDVKKVDE